MQAVFAFVLCALFNAAIEVCRAGEGGLQTLQVTDVSENSATLHWESSASKLAKGQLKLVCTGSSVYTLQSGAQHVGYSTSAQAAPRDINRTSLSDLHPNTNYTCVVIYEDHDVREVYSNSAHFCTYYSDPSPPPAPLVLPVPEKQQQNQSVYPVLLQVDLLPASTRYGPIHGYELQFFVVLPHEVKSGRIKHPIQHQLGLPYGAQTSLQDATSATEAVNFAYRMYKSGSLPMRVNISTQLVGGALKQNTTYSAVLLAYTNDTVHKQILLSYSPFSKFFFIPDRVPGVTSQFRQVYREALSSIVFGSALPVLAVVGFVLLTVALGWKIRKKRSRNYHRKQMLRPVFTQPYMRRPAEQCGEDHRHLLDEASDSEEQSPSSKPAPSQATAQPSMQTSEAGAVGSQEKTEVPHVEDMLSNSAYIKGPDGSLRKEGVVEADLGHGFGYTEHTAATKCSSKWQNNCRRKSTSVKYTKLACMPSSSDSEGDGARESRPPLPNRSATGILAHQTIKTSTPASENAFPPLSSLSAVVHTPAEGGATSTMKPQAGVGVQLGKGGTGIELRSDFLGKASLDLQTTTLVQLPSGSEPAESDVPTLSSAEKFDLLSRNQMECLPFNPYCLVNPAGPKQLCRVKVEEGEDVAGSDHVYELARMYNRQYCGTDLVTTGGERTVDLDHCEPQVVGICSAEWDLGDIVSPDALALQSTASYVGNCPQFSPPNKETCPVPGLLESNSSLIFPQELSLSSVPCLVRDSDPSLLHLPSRCVSGEMEGIMSTDSFTVKQPLMHSSDLVLPSNDPISPPVTPMPPNGPRPCVPQPKGSVCRNLGLPQPQEEGLLLLLQRDTPEANTSTASFDLPTVPSDVDICSKFTLVGPSSSSDQIVQP